jgi:RHS repeat-associated protein
MLDGAISYNRARYYHTGIASWLSLDPFEGDADAPLSLSGYGYVHGNPVNAVDPSGRCEWPTNWANPIDVRCRYLAEGLANRFAVPVESLIHLPYHQLEWLTVYGTVASITGAANQLVVGQIAPVVENFVKDQALFALYVLDRASIFPQLLFQNPSVALQAFGQGICTGELGGIMWANFAQPLLFSSFGRGALQAGMGGTTTATGTSTAAGGLSGIAGGLAIFAMLMATPLTNLYTDYQRATRKQVNCDVKINPDESVADVIYGSPLSDIIAGRRVVSNSERPFIYRDLVEQYAKQFCNRSPAPSIQITHAQTFDILSDGHHRFVASRLLTKRFPERSVEITGGLLTAIYIGSTNVNETDRGYYFYEWVDLGWR